jgi:hypothetical protein
LRSFALRPAFCGLLGAGTGCSARSVVAAVVDAVTAGANASSLGELDRDAESCRLTGALTAGEGGETVVESVVLALAGAVAIVLGLRGAVAIGLGLRGKAAIVLRLWETAAITDLPSPSWPAICTTTPLALAIDPQTSAAASGRGWCMMPPNPTAFPGRARSRLPLLVAPAVERFNADPHRGPMGAAGPRPRAGRGRSDYRRSAGAAKQVARIERSEIRDADSSLESSENPDVASLHPGYARWCTAGSRSRPCPLWVKSRPYTVT